MTITDYRSLIIRRIRMDKQGEMAKVGEGEKC